MSFTVPDDGYKHKGNTDSPVPVFMELFTK